MCVCACFYSAQVFFFLRTLSPGWKMAGHPVWFWWSSVDSCGVLFAVQHCGRIVQTYNPRISPTRHFLLKLNPKEILLPVIWETNLSSATWTWVNRTGDPWLIESYTYTDNAPHNCYIVIVYFHCCSFNTICNLYAIPCGGDFKLFQSELLI